MTPPGFPDVSPPILINNAGGSRQRADDFEVEIILDARGSFHDPVVLSRRVNPVVIYVSLEWLCRIPSLEPALQDGQPVATTYTVMIEFKVSAYSGALVLNEEPDEP